MQADRAALSVHTVFSTACAPYFDWQSAGLGLSHRRVRQPGPLTRLIACSDAYYAERSLRVPIDCASLGVLIGLIVCVAGAGAALLLRTARRSVARALLPSSSPLRRKRRL